MVTFQEFEKEARWILRFQNKKSMDEFLSISEMVLGFSKLSESQIESLVEDHYIEGLRGGVPKHMVARSALKLQIRLSNEFPASYYKKVSSPCIKDQKKALKYLYALKEMQTVRKVDGLCLDINTLQNYIAIIEDSIKANNVLNTGGKPTNINDQELVALIRLKNAYTVSFPKNSNRYTPGNLLHQLGECLIEKSISRKIHISIDKAKDYLESHE